MKENLHRPIKEYAEIALLGSNQQWPLAVKKKRYFKKVLKFTENLEIDCLMSNDNWNSILVF